MILNDFYGKALNFHEDTHVTVYDLYSDLGNYFVDYLTENVIQHMIKNI